MGIDRRSVLQGSGKLAALAVAAGMAGPALAACGPPGAGPAVAPAGKPVSGGMVTLGSIGDGKTMQPLLASDAPSRGYLNLHYNAPLLRVNPETLVYEAKYGTADTFQLSPDGLTLTFKLKPDVQWSDGHPITAADYKFTFDRMLDPTKVEYPYKSLYNSFQGLDAPDEKTLIFKLKEPFCPAIDYASINPIPKHIFENLDLNDNPLNQQPTVGSGPWLMREWQKDSHAVFVANEKFYLGRPPLDRIVYRVVEDQTVAYSMLKSGEIDQASIQAADWEEAKRLPNIQTFNLYQANASWVYIGFNTRSELLKDLRVRQALAHAIDRKKLIDAIRMGLARPIDSHYTPSSWAHSDEVPKLDYDVAKAKKLLDDAGWLAPSSNPNGTRVKDGKPLKMRIFYNSGNKEREQIATIAQQYAKAIGVELEVIREEWNAYLDRVNKTRDMELFILGWSSSIEPHGMQNIWITTGGQNSTAFSDPNVDELYPKAAAVPGCSQADRKKLYGEIQKLVSAQSPYIFLWENQILSGLSKRIVPNSATKLGYDYRSWEWYSTTGK